MREFTCTELVVDACAALAEGPAWDPATEQLVWLDIPTGDVHLYDPASGRSQTFDVGRTVGAAAPRAPGGLVLAVREGFGTLDPATGTFELIAPVEHDLDHRMNDGGCDPQGRFWAGSTNDGAPDTADSALYRLDTDGSVATVLEGVTVSNGIGWSPDGTFAYYVDTPAHRIDRFRFDAGNGSLSDRRPLVVLPTGSGHPDGLAVDIDGCIWLAVWGAWTIHRYTPEGRLDGQVRLPVSTPSSCAFGGPGLRTLYITTGRTSLTDSELAAQSTAGGIFACDVGVAGLPVASYGA